MNLPDKDGYDLWLRYRKIDDAARLAQYRNAIKRVVVLGASATAEILRREFARALPALLDVDVPIVDKPTANALVVGTIDELKTIGVSLALDDSRNLGDEGFIIASVGDTKQSPRFASDLQ
ncbi:MAG: alpha-glucuronidase family glycosyl hydrolase, partial [Chloroflexota bacterium]